MKKLSIILSVMLFSSVLAIGQEKGKEKDEMLFDKTSHDFGQLAYASDGSVVFKFRNNSKDPIALTNVKSSCGCTVPTWSREPIKPGESSEILVKYNTNLPGSFNKTIQVFSTAKNSPVRLSIRGNVKPIDKAMGQTQGAVSDESASKTGKVSQDQGNTFPLTKGARLKESGNLKKHDLKTIEAQRKKK